MHLLKKVLTFSSTAVQQYSGAACIRDQFIVLPHLSQRKPQVFPRAILSCAHFRKQQPRYFRQAFCSPAAVSQDHSSNFSCAVSQPQSHPRVHFSSTVPHEARTMFYFIWSACRAAVAPVPTHKYISHMRESTSIGVRQTTMTPAGGR